MFFMQSLINNGRLEQVFTSAVRQEKPKAMGTAGKENGEQQ